MKLYLKLLFLLTVIVMLSYTLMESVERNLPHNKRSSLKAEISKRANYNDTRVRNYRISIIDYKAPYL